MDTLDGGAETHKTPDLGVALERNPLDKAVMTPVDLMIGVAGTIVLTWLVFVLVLVIVRPRGVDLAEAKRFVPDVIRLARDLAKDESLGRSARWKLLLLLAYLSSPVDLMPDFFPVVGYADDVIIVAVVLRSMIRRAGSAALEQHWSGTQHGLLVIRRLTGAGKT